MKKIKCSILLLLSCIMIAIIPLNTKAAAPGGGSTGYQPLVLEHRDPTAQEQQQLITKTYRNRSGTAGKWDMYSSTYFYDHLNSKQKTLYNDIYNVCMDYLVNSTDSPSNGYTAYVGAPDGITFNETYTTLMLLMTNCPQFYFISSTAYYSGTRENINAVCLGMYSDFVSGARRRQSTLEVERKLDTWIAQVNTKMTALAKETEAHKIICENTEYDYSMSSSYHQSCAGVFLEGKAVCAGYAEAFQMLCQGVGIETITVTSADHEWNLVKLYGNWYHVDTTWDDTDSGYRTTYLNVSDQTIGGGSHIPESLWSPLNVPKCYYDTVIRTVYRGVDYAAVFDEEYYLSKYPDIARAYAGNVDQVLAHFVNYGMSEGRQGCQNFDVFSYKRQYADLRAAYGNNLKSYYLHYVNFGKKEGRKGTGCTTLQGAITRLNGVDYSAVYDFNYYISIYPDIRSIYGDDDIGALQHFVNFGMKEGRQGKASFNVTSYAYQYSDLRNAYGNNLPSYYRHYINYGQTEQRAGTGCTTMQGTQTVYNGVDYSAVYNYSYYVGKYPDIKRAFGNNDYKVLQHFVNYGMKEGRQGAANFEVRSYYNRYADLRRSYGTNWQYYYIHYMRYGSREGRSAVDCTSLQNPTTVYHGVNYGAVYNYNFYIGRNPDVAKAYGGDEDRTLWHFVNYGMREGRQGSADFNVHNYANRYGDLKSAYGSNWKSYYLHYMNYGSREGRNGK